MHGVRGLACTSGVSFSFRRFRCAIDARSSCLPAPSADPPSAPGATLAFRLARRSLMRALHLLTAPLISGMSSSCPLPCMIEVRRIESSRFDSSSEHEVSPGGGMRWHFSICVTRGEGEWGASDLCETRVGRVRCFTPARRGR